MLSTASTNSACSGWSRESVAFERGGIDCPPAESLRHASAARRKRWAHRHEGRADDRPLAGHLGRRGQPHEKHLAHSKGARGSGRGEPLYRDGSEGGISLRRDAAPGAGVFGSRRVSGCGWAPSRRTNRDPGGEGRTEKDRRPRVVAVAAILAVTLALGWVAIEKWRGRAREAPAMSSRSPAVIPARRCVAVLGFQNLSGRPDAAWLSTAVSEMISAELAGGDKLRLVPAENVARLGGVRAVAGTLSRETLANLRANLDADVVLSGSYVALHSPDGPAVRFDMTLQDTSTGESLSTVTETGNEGDLFKLVSSAGDRLRGDLGLGFSSSQPASIGSSLPNDRAAARLYAEGLAKLRGFDALGARPLLEESIRGEPGFAPRPRSPVAGLVGARIRRERAPGGGERVSPRERLLAGRSGPRRSAARRGPKEMGARPKSWTLRFSVRIPMIWKPVSGSSRRRSPGDDPERLSRPFPDSQLCRRRPATMPGSILRARMPSPPSRNGGMSSRRPAWRPRRRAGAARRSCSRQPASAKRVRFGISATRARGGELTRKRRRCFEAPATATAKRSR